MKYFYQKSKTGVGESVEQFHPQKGGGGDAGGTVEHFLIQQIKSKIVRKQNKS